MYENGKLVLLPTKIVKNIKVNGTENHVDRFITEFDKKGNWGQKFEVPEE